MANPPSASTCPNTRRRTPSARRKARYQSRAGVQLGTNSGSTIRRVRLAASPSWLRRQPASGPTARKFTNVRQQRLLGRDAQWARSDQAAHCLPILQPQSISFYTCLLCTDKWSTLSEKKLQVLGKLTVQHCHVLEKGAMKKTQKQARQSSNASMEGILDQAQPVIDLLRETAILMQWCRMHQLC